MEVYETLPVVPLRGVVVLPHMLMPFVIGRVPSTRAVEQALVKDKRIFLAAQRDASVDDPKPDEIYTVGCVANVVQSVPLPDGNLTVLVEGVDRARAAEWKEDKGFYHAVVKVLAKEKVASGDVHGTMGRVMALFEQYARLSNTKHYDTMVAAARVDDPGQLADIVSGHLLVGVNEKQNLLETISSIERLNRVASILEIEVDKRRLDWRIRSRVKEQLKTTRKEYYLNEKKKAIQIELDELKDKLAKKLLPQDAELKALEDLNRLEAMSLGAIEASLAQDAPNILAAVVLRKAMRENRERDRLRRISARGVEAWTQALAAGQTQEPSGRIAQLIVLGGLLGGFVGSLLLAGIGWLIGRLSN